jgi:hypothetical protein
MPDQRVISIAAAIALALIVLGLGLLAGWRTIRRGRPTGLPAPDRAATRDCFNPSRADRRMRY